MAVIVICPGCKGRLGVMETAAGSKVKCPKCERMVPVPAPDDALFEDEFEVVEEDDFEVVEDETPKKKPKRAVEDDDDRPRKKKAAVTWDDDEDDDDRPRKKSFKKKSDSSSKMPLILGGAVLGVLLLGGVGYLLFSGSGSKGLKPSSDKWVKFDAPDGTFSASFPGSSPQSGDFLDMVSSQNKPPDADAQMQLIRSAGIQTAAYKTVFESRRYMIGTFVIPEALINLQGRQAVQKNMVDGMQKGLARAGGKQLEERMITISGHQGKAVRAESNSGQGNPACMAVLFTGNTVYFIVVEGSESITLDDEMFNQFISKFEVKNAAPVTAPKGDPGGERPRTARPGRGR